MLGYRAAPPARGWPAPWATRSAFIIPDDKAYCPEEFKAPSNRLPHGQESCRSPHSPPSPLPIGPGEGDVNLLQYSCLEQSLAGSSPWGCKESDTQIIKLGLRKSTMTSDGLNNSPYRTVGLQSPQIDLEHTQLFWKSSKGSLPWTYHWPMSCIQAAALPSPGPHILFVCIP